MTNAAAHSPTLENVPLFADVDWESLISIGEALEDLRRQDVDSVEDTQAAIVRL